MNVRVCSATIALVTLAFAVQAEQDVKGSADHPLFPNRMPGYYISNYQQHGFASFRFGTRPRQAIEGKYTRIYYRLIRRDQHPGGLAIRRNYENAIREVGGEIVHSDDGASVMRVVRNGIEHWVELQANDKGLLYFVHIIEREPMRQVITADAIAAALDKDGFLSLDVHFATGKAELLSESSPVIAEVVAMMAKRPGFRVGIEGHTDNTGTPEGNRALSTARAKAVAAAIAAGGIDGKRLEPSGFGQERPVADNRTEEGRAKNRRVEIVKR